MIFSCSMRAVSLYFKNLRYIYALKSSFDFVDFVSYYWNRGNKSSLDKRERLNGISGLPLPQSLRYLRWNWSTLAWGVVFFATISLNFPSYFLLIHSIVQLFNIVVLAGCKFSFRRLDWSLALFEGCIENHLLDHDIYHNLILFAVKPHGYFLKAI